jgi:hypothetical protein
MKAVPVCRGVSARRFRSQAEPMCNMVSTAVPTMAE